MYYIDKNQPWFYMYSPSRSPLPPPSLPDPSGSSQSTRSKHLSHASNLGWSTPVLDKNSYQGGYRGNISQKCKICLWQIHSQYNGEKSKGFPLKSGIRQGCPLSPLFFNIVLEVLDTVIKQEIKSIQIGRKETILSLYTDDMTPYMENPKDFTQKLLELKNKFSKVAGYKINMVAFLHTDNETSESIKKYYLLKSPQNKILKNKPH